MSFPVIRLTYTALFSLLLAVSVCAQEWREVTPAELQQKSPMVEPDADAEAMFWEVRVDDSSDEGLTMKHYVRVKIFTERGREKFAKMDIQYFKGMKIKDIMARVIKPDGSIVELAKTDIFDREIVKLDKVKVKAKSFAVPNIEPGVIVEYQYKEVIPGSSANNMRMVFQRDIPIQKSSYFFRPYANGRVIIFNMPNSDFVKDKGGYQRLTLEKVPALKEEPRMPPEDEVRSWVLIHYTEIKDTSDFWSNAGFHIAKNYEIRDTLKPGKELKAAVEQIVAGAGSPDEQMRRLFDYCKTKIKNLTYDTSTTDEEKEKIKPNKSTFETFQKAQGTATEINELFASMVTTLGYEARLAFGGDRSEQFFNPARAHVSFIHFSAIAVKTGNGWRYFDPGSIFVPYGMLSWFEEDTAVLLLGYKDYIRTETPFSDYTKSAAKRSGQLKLLADGTLEGTVRIEYTGHRAHRYKIDNYEASPAKREEDLKEAWKARISAAEISDVSIDNVMDPEKPVVIQFKLRVPSYAQRTGKRLFIQPGLFEFGSTPVFSSATRKYDIFFQYPWSETDSIDFEMPEGFMLDNPVQPAPIADPNKIGSLEIKMGSDGKSLQYRRQFHFGGGGNVLFRVANYEPLKNLFDAFNKADTHTITLREK